MHQNVSNYVNGFPVDVVLLDLPKYLTLFHTEDGKLKLSIKVSHQHLKIEYFDRILKDLNVLFFLNLMDYKMFYLLNLNFLIIFQKFLSYLNLIFLIFSVY